MKKQYIKPKLSVFLLEIIAFMFFFNVVIITSVEAKIKPDPTAKIRLQENYGKLPLSFEANQGQTDKNVRFISRGQGYGLFLTPTEAVLSLHKSEASKNKPGKSKQHISSVSAGGKGVNQSVQNSHDEVATLRMKLLGSNPNPHMKGVDELPGKVNYFRGKDSKHWQNNIPTYSKARYEQVYPGIDLVYYGNQRQLEYDFIIAPGADPQNVRLAFDGAQKVTIDKQGDALLHTRVGDVRLNKPFAYQIIDGERHAVDVSFVLNNNSSVHKQKNQLKSKHIGFEVVAYDSSQALIIDPILAYSSYLGGASDDLGYGIAVDSAGNAYITGTTNSTNFPVANANYSNLQGDTDVFVTKIDSSGSKVLYSTYLGGTWNEGASSWDGSNANGRGGSIAVDNAGNAYVTGITASYDFPTVNALYPNYGGFDDAFVTKLNSNGSQLIYSTFLGGRELDYGSSIAVDSSGNSYITGMTVSSDFPTVDPIYSTMKGFDAFVTKINTNGSKVLYSTYLGGNLDDLGYGIAVDITGNAYVTGRTHSNDFPVVNALFPNFAGGYYDAFVTKLSASGSQILYSTYLGGGGDDHGFSMAVDRLGNAYVTGYTQSINYPVVNAVYPNLGGGGVDAFVTKLNTSGSQVLYSTYLGGSSWDYGYGIAADSAGNAYITGLTASSNFPMVNALYVNLRGSVDAFVTKLSPSGAQVPYSTYLGGNNNDIGYSIAVDSIGNFYIAGQTLSSDFPTHANDSSIISYDSHYNGGAGDAFLVKISDTTTLPNSATLGIASSISPSGSTAEPVNTSTGNYYYQHNDLSLAGQGLPFAFIRTYNAQDSYSGPLGRGWTHSYNLVLRENSGGAVTIKQGDGHEEFYDPDGNGGYTSRYAGLYSRLIKNPDNSYTLITKDVIIYSFAVDGKLAAVNDRNGNALSFVYDGVGDLTSITDSAGRTINLSLDANHRITTLSEPLGRQIQFAYDGDGHLVSDTDAQGGIQTYSYDVNHHLTQSVDRRGHVLVGNAYDNSNRVIAQVNGKGSTTTFEYDNPNVGETIFTNTMGHASIHTHDSLHRLITETDPLGNKTHYVYDANNNRTSVTDKNGNITAFTYDAQGNVLTKTDAKAQVSTLQYNTFNDPTRIVDALSQVTTFAYDGKGNLNEVTDALGHKTKVTYDASGQPLSVTNALGAVTQNTFNPQGNLIQVEDALGHKTMLTYDAIGRRTGMTDANGHASSFSYDNNGNLVSVTDPLSHTTHFTYDANNNRIGVTDPRGNATAFVYDANDLLSKATDPLGNFVQFAYDAADNRTAVTDPRGNITHYAYDAANRLTQVTDALSHATTLAYDANDNLLTQTNPLGHTSSFAYDELNRLLNATDALGNKGFRSYDALGRLTQAKDAQGRITQYAYDVLGRLTKVTDAKSGTVVYDYDALGNRLAVTDPNGQTTDYSYDALNRLTAKTDPLGQAYSYSYDPVGNRISLTDAKGQNLLYNYDDNNRLAVIAYPDNTQVSFSYDAAGNRIKMIDKLGTSTYAFDALNRLDAYTDTFGKTVTNEYDKAGNRTALIYPDGKRVTYGYDSLNRMATVTDWLNGVTNYSYDAASKLAAVLNPNNTQVSYGYDAAERLVNLANAKADTSVLASYVLMLDAVGNRSGINRSEPLAPVFTNKTQALTFDNDNRLLTLDASAVTNDPNGNLTAEPGKSFQYDFEDRLVAATGDQIAQFSYDGNTQRPDDSLYLGC